MPVEVTVNKLLNFQLVNLNINILNNQMQVDQGRIHTKEKRVLHYARTFSSVLNLFGSFFLISLLSGSKFDKKINIQNKQNKNNYWLNQFRRFHVDWINQ